MRKKNFIFSKWFGGIIVIFALCIAGSLTVLFMSPAPQGFISPTKVKIEKNSTLDDVATLLKEKKIIYSTLLFKIGVKLMNGEKSILAEEYFFEKPENVWSIAHRFTTGDIGVKKVKVTIPEGASVKEMAKIFKRTLLEFDADKFVKAALPHEGYLFPDTYYFLPFVPVEDIIAVMKDNFDKKISDLEPLIEKSERNIDEIVAMASILEKEVNTTETRQTVAGILWKRLDEGMPLQVDVSLETYKTKGLPEKPITNPGFNAIKDALTPIDTKFWYYLSDPTGEIHYGMDYEAHLRNIDKYLR